MAKDVKKAPGVKVRVKLGGKGTYTPPPAEKKEEK